MNKKRFAILIVIALILSSFTFAYANNSGGNNDNKEKTSNRKIHVHLEANRDDINEVWVVIGGEEIELKANGNSGNYTAPKGGDLVSGTLTKIIVHTSNGIEEFDPAVDEQQGQEGQGSINYRIRTTETIDNEDDTETEGPGGDNPGGSTGGSTGGSSTDGGIVGEGDEGNSDNGDINNGTEEVKTDDTDDSTDSTTENDESFITIELTIQEIPQGTPELQEITSTKETLTDTEIEEETLDLEDEETPLAIPSTGVATPLLYGAGALISLLGLLKRR
jgi:hypothetical protein